MQIMGNTPDKKYHLLLVVSCGNRSLLNTAEIARKAPTEMQYVSKHFTKNDIVKKDRSARKKLIISEVAEQEKPSEYDKIEMERRFWR